MGWLAAAEVEGWRLGAVLLVYLTAGTVKGALGFGLPLIAGAVLPQLVPLPLVLAINAVILPITNTVQFARAGDTAGVAGRHWPVLLGLALAVPLGALVVARADPRWVMLLFGLFITLAAALSWAVPDWRIPRGANGSAGLATGLAGGLVAALTTAPGPLFVIYLVGRGVERAERMGALGLFLLASGLLVAGSFWSLGVLDGARAFLALVCLVPALGGMWLGDRLAGRVPAARLRAVVLLVLVVLGVRATVAAAMQLLA